MTGEDLKRLQALETFLVRKFHLVYIPGPPLSKTAPAEGHEMGKFIEKNAGSCKKLFTGCPPGKYPVGVWCRDCTAWEYSG